MKTSLSTVAFIISFATTVYAQTKLVEPVNRINLDLFQTGLNYSREFPVAARSTIEENLGISARYYIDDFAVQLSPQVAIDYKFYYNIPRRNEKGKKIKKQ